MKLWKAHAIKLAVDSFAERGSGTQRYSATTAQGLTTLDRTLKQDFVAAATVHATKALQQRRTWRSHKTSQQRHDSAESSTVTTVTKIKKSLRSW